MSRRLAPGFLGLVLLASLAPVASPGVARAAKPCGGAQPTITGTPRSEAIRGTAGADVIRSGRGDDLVRSLGGNDIICAGPGFDTTNAGPGDDRVRTGRGDDVASGGDGRDRIEGQGGFDEADGGEGTDGCLVEKRLGCEADIGVTAGGPGAYTGGDRTVFEGTLSVDNNGPSPVDRATASGRLPPQAEFAAERSDPRCSEVATDLIECSPTAIAIRDRARFAIAFRFPDCPPGPQKITFLAAARDLQNTDPLPDNDTFSITLDLTPAASCP